MNFARYIALAVVLYITLARSMEAKREEAKTIENEYASLMLSNFQHSRKRDTDFTSRLLSRTAQRGDSHNRMYLLYVPYPREQISDEPTCPNCRRFDVVRAAVEASNLGNIEYSSEDFPVSKTESFGVIHFRFKKGSDYMNLIENEVIRFNLANIEPDVKLMDSNPDIQYMTQDRRRGTPHVDNIKNVNKVQMNANGGGIRANSVPGETTAPPPKDRSSPNPPAYVPWWLDALDQTREDLDGLGIGDYHYSINNQGEGSTIFHVDFGVHADHNEFRKPDGSSRVKFDQQVITNVVPFDDMTSNHHGTSTAAYAIGKYLGVAKKAEMYSWKVRDDAANEMSYLATANAINRAYVLMNTNVVSRPAAFTCSLGLWIEYPKCSVEGTCLMDIIFALNSLIYKGVPVTLASGNTGDNVCDLAAGTQWWAPTFYYNFYSHIGSYNMKYGISSNAMGPMDDITGTSFDTPGNQCIDTFAPGIELNVIATNQDRPVVLYEPWNETDYYQSYYGQNSYHYNLHVTGTSYSTPMVAAAKAIMMVADPEFYLTFDNERVHKELQNRIRDQSSHRFASGRLYWGASIGCPIEYCPQKTIAIRPFTLMAAKGCGTQ